MPRICVKRVPTMPYRGLKTFLESVETDDGPEVIVWVLELLVSEEEAVRLERGLQRDADQLMEQLQSAA